VVIDRRGVEGKASYLYCFFIDCVLFVFVFVFFFFFVFVSASAFSSTGIVQDTNTWMLLVASRLRELKRTEVIVRGLVCYHKVHSSILAQDMTKKQMDRLSCTSGVRTAPPLQTITTNTTAGRGHAATR
jgi:hypothetical protein